MDLLNSTMITPDRERGGQHLRFEERCSIRIFKKLGYCTPEELFEKFLDQIYSVDKVQSSS